MSIVEAEAMEAGVAETINWQLLEEEVESLAPYHWTEAIQREGG